jgi:hypothetical protein
MTRGDFESPVTAAPVIESEQDADWLALELLAPFEYVLRFVDAHKIARRASELTAALRDEFGLPSVAASLYARMTFPDPYPSDSLLDRLGLKT